MKILIVSISAGAGHVRAAEAIRRTAVRDYPDAIIEHIDMIDFVNPAMKHMLVDAYEVLASHLPEVWGFLYDQANHDTSTSMKKLTRMINSVNGRRFFDYLAESRPDKIICTHCLPAHAIRSAKLESIANTPLSVVITDYNLHEWWLVPGAAEYFVATQKIAWQMQQRGYEHVNVTGIPIMPEFSDTKDPAELRNKYGIAPDAYTVLLLSGGHGLVKIDHVLTAIAQMQKPVTIISIAGNNERLQRKLSKIALPPHIISKVVGWTDAIDEYMRIADVIITKPGGVTTSECIALRKPMILIRPIPGQEECNSDYILTSGYGVLARTISDLHYDLSRTATDIAPGYAELTPGIPAAKRIVDTIIQK